MDLFFKVFFHLFKLRFIIVGFHLKKFSCRLDTLILNILKITKFEGIQLSPWTAKSQSMHV